MKIKEIGFVAIPVTDIPRARKFYEEVLGLQVSDEMMGGKWIEYTVGDNTLAIANVGERVEAVRSRDRCRAGGGKLRRSD